MGVEIIFGVKFIIIESRWTEFEEIGVINLLCRSIQSRGDLLVAVFSMKWKMQRRPGFARFFNHKFKSKTS